MKKYSKLLLILSALLCVVMLFASCDDEPDDKGGDSAYKQMVDEWLTYINYDSTDATVSASELLKIDDRVVVNQMFNDYILATCEHKYTVGNPIPKENPDNPNEKQTYEATVDLTYNLYNLKIGATPIFTKTVPGFTTVVDVASNADCFDRIATVKEPKTAYVEYDIIFIDNFETGEFSGIFCVETTSYVPGTPTDEDPDPEAVRDKATYTIYHENGTVLMDNIKEEDFVLPVCKTNKAYDDGSTETIFNEVIVGNEKLILKDGDIVVRLNANDNRAIPETTVEYNGYHYTKYTEQLPTGYYSHKIQVLDSNYNMVWEKDLGMSMSDSTWEVLSNGDVWVQSAELVTEEGADYDVNVSMMKMKFAHQIISLADASVKDVEMNFVVNNFASKATKQTFNILGDYNIVSANNITENKTMGSDATWYVLDNNLAVVKELTNPVIAPATALPIFLENNVFVMGDANGAFFKFDNSANAPVPFINVNDNDVMSLENGYVINGIIYNEKLDQLIDLNSRYGAGNFTCYINGYVLATSSTSQSSSPSQTVYLVNDHGNLTWFSVEQNKFAFYRDLIKNGNSFYDKNGQSITVATNRDTDFQLTVLDSTEGIYAISYYADDYYSADTVHYIVIYK